MSCRRERAASALERASDEERKRERTHVELLKADRRDEALRVTVEEGAVAERAV